MTMRLGTTQIAVSSFVDEVHLGAYVAFVLDSRYRHANNTVIIIAGKTTMSMSTAAMIISVFSLAPTLPLGLSITTLLQAVRKIAEQNNKNLFNPLPCIVAK